MISRSWVFNSKGSCHAVKVRLSSGVVNPFSKIHWLTPFPSAYNKQETDLYVAVPTGLYIYRAKENLLEQVLEEDIRKETGGPTSAQIAPVRLIYVADYNRMKVKKEFYSAAAAGFIGQNVYLFCASEGLHTVVHETGNREKLGTLMKLKPEQHIIFAQSVGYAP